MSGWYQALNCWPTRQLRSADKQILTTIESLSLADVGEREYLAQGVIVVEAWFTKLRTFLRQLDKAILRGARSAPRLLPDGISFGERAAPGWSHPLLTSQSL